MLFRSLNTKKNLVDSFNIVSGEWNEKDIKFYLNGELIAYYNRSFDVPMGLVLNTSVAKKGGSFKPGPNKDTHFPGEFIVDYVRVWKSQTDANSKVGAPPEITLSDNAKNKVIGANSKASKKIKFFNGVKKKETGLITVSILPVKGKKILITALSANKIKGEVLLVDQTNASIQKTESLKAGETLIDLSSFTSNEVQVTIRAGKKNALAKIQIR